MTAAIPQQATTGHHAWIPLAKLQASPLNHRKTFNKEKLAELAESIRLQGVIQPIVARPLADGFEVVARERRFRAAKTAGLVDIPAVVRELTDVQVLELQVIENGQREDPHPIEEAERRGYALAMRAMIPTAERLKTLGSSITEHIEAFEQDLQRLAAKSPAPAPRTVTSSPEYVVRHTPAARKTAASTSSLPKGEHIVLTAIAQHRQGVTREQLTVLTGYKRSTRDAYIQRLRERQLIVDGSVLTATQAGVDTLGADFEPLPTGKALLEHWMGRLPKGERRVLEIVVQGWPQHVNRELISERTGYARSSRDAYLQRLGARQLVTAERGQVRASETLFGSSRR